MEEKEFEDLISRYKNMMYRLAKRMLVNHDDARDSVQDALTKLWLRRKDLRTDKNLQALFMITMKNICFDRLKNKNPEFVSLDILDNTIENSIEYNYLGNNELIDKIK